MYLSLMLSWCLSGVCRCFLFFFFLLSFYMLFYYARIWASAGWVDGWVDAVSFLSAMEYRLIPTIPT